MLIPDYVRAFVMRWEGGATETNDPNDTGGRTKYGISAVNNPEVDFDTLTEETAFEIYERKYWRPANCEDLPDYMRLAQFNCSVNCGPDTARRVLQKAVGAKADGKIGPKTRAKIKAFGTRPRIFIGKYCTFQALYYFNIVQRRRSQHVWLKGWIRRTVDVVFVTAERIGRGKNHA